MKGKNHHGVGAGLSLERFAQAKVSSYDKRAVLEREAQEKLRQRSKFKKLKRRLETEQRLGSALFEVKDNGETTRLAAFQNGGSALMAWLEQMPNWPHACMHCPA